MKKRRESLTPVMHAHVLKACLALTITSLGFLLADFTANGLGHWYLAWNLFLAWVPVSFAILCIRMAYERGWGSWQTIAAFLLWLGFLPNTFYIITDYIHLFDSSKSSPLFNVALFGIFAITGMALGLYALYIVHRRLAKIWSPLQTNVFIAATLAACSFAVYLGRVLRWNTWDILINPAGILFDVSDRLIDPERHPETIATTCTFFALLGGLYIATWLLGQGSDE